MWKQTKALIIRLIISFTQTSKQKQQQQQQQQTNKNNNKKPPQFLNTHTNKHFKYRMLNNPTYLFVFKTHTKLS